VDLDVSPIVFDPVRHSCCCHLEIFGEALRSVRLEAPGAQILTVFVGR
jgi:hypothetical protein